MSKLVEAIKSVAVFYAEGKAEDWLQTVQSELGNEPFRQGAWTLADLLHLHFTCKVAQPEEIISSAARLTNVKAFLDKCEVLQGVFVWTKANVLVFSASSCTPDELREMAEIVKSHVHVPMFADPGRGAFGGVLRRVIRFIRRRLLGIHPNGARTHLWRRHGRN